VTNRLALTMFGAASTATALLGTLVPGVAAHADETSFRLVSDFLNTSDPFAIACNDPSRAFVGTCLYTSSDTGNPADMTNGNPYPMVNTLLFTLPQGEDPSVQSNWTYQGVVFSENQITLPVGFVPQNSNHLWAPTVAFNREFGGWVLYVPDVSNDSPWGQSHTSEIAVAESSSPFGPFTYMGTAISPGPGLYASDPAVLRATDGSQWMAYADGDFSTCGGISMGQLDPTMLGFSSVPQPVEIVGIDALGNCGGTGRPYLEGPQIYDTRVSFPGTDVPGPFLMVVAAKPDHIPTECGFPQPNSANEVLAYATSVSPQGPYQYQGLLMCGSATEWTNQGSLLMMPDRTARNRLVLFYHDGPSANPSPDRKVHAECLFYGSGQISMVTRSQDWTNLGFSSPTFSSCMANPNGADDSAVGLTFESAFGGTANPPHNYVTAENNGTAPLVDNRFGIGPWEIFHLNLANSGESVDIQSTTNNQWVVPQFDGHLIASSNFPSGQFATGIWSGRGCTSLTTASGAAVKLDPANPNLLIAQGSPGGTLTCILHM
jgi:hypothetical protein